MTHMTLLRPLVVERDVRARVVVVATSTSQASRGEDEEEDSPMSKLPQLVDEKEASERFRIPLNTLRAWRSCGDGPDYYKLGTAKRSPVRYDVEVLTEWLRVHLRVQKARATAQEKHVAL